jgi:hypothetical protein
MPLPPLSDQEKLERQRTEIVRKEKRKFHDIQWDKGETMDWFRLLFEMSGLPILEGWGGTRPY